MTCWGSFCLLTLACVVPVSWADSPVVSSEAGVQDPVATAPGTGPIDPANYAILPRLRTERENRLLGGDHLGQIEQLDGSGWTF